MEFKEYIRDLLFSYDCVVIPGFGGFIGSYASAEINSRTHIFSPPSKNIVFNTHLKRDDGLLIHHIATSEKHGYAFVKDNLEVVVRQWEYDLNNGKQLDFPGIGTITPEKENKLNFHPDRSVNFLEASFGLETVSSPLIDRRRHHKRIEKKFIDRKPRPVVKRKKAVYWTGALTLPVLVISLWLLFEGNLNFLGSPQESGLMPETSMPGDIKETAKEDLQNAGVPPDPVSDEIGIKTDIASVSAEGEEKIETGQKQRIEAPGPEMRYFIIGGAFREEGNAKKLMKELEDKGYHPVIAGKTSAGLTMVSIEAFGEKKDAVHALVQIKKSWNNEVWLYLKKEPS